jgi:TonB family protein
MKKWLIRSLSITLIFCGASSAQKAKQEIALPDQIILGRNYFIDIGPPFDSYEVISLRSTASGLQIERVTLSPPGDACLQPASAETSTATISQSMDELLGHVNPCSIPEKDLKREIKRCKHCLVFSGANVTMELQCGAQNRKIRMDILDRDLFDKNANTPKNTSWTRSLLDRIDQILGSNNIMDKPIFQISLPQDQPVAPLHSNLLTAIADGKFDELFGANADKLSELFKQAQIVPPTPSVSLLSAISVPPVNAAMPSYPPIARAAHVEGTVNVRFEIGDDGQVTGPEVLDGPPMLRNSVLNALKTWSFPKEDTGKQIESAIQFKLNCISPSRP